MGDRPGSSFRVRMSEDKVRRKDWCWSVRVVLVLVKLPDVSGPGLVEAGRYTRPTYKPPYFAPQFQNKQQFGQVRPNAALPAPSQPNAPGIRNPTPQSNNYPCFNYGKTGHWLRDCPYPRQQNQNVQKQ